MEMNTKQENLTFKEHLEKRKNALPEFRDDIRKLLGGIAYETFYLKVRTNSFSYTEKIVIANYLHQDVNELFPEPSKKTA